MQPEISISGRRRERVLREIRLCAFWQCGGHTSYSRQCTKHRWHIRKVRHVFGRLRIRLYARTVLLWRCWKPGSIVAPLVWMEDQDIRSRSVGPEALTADDVGAGTVEG